MKFLLFDCLLNHDFITVMMLRTNLNDQNEVKLQLIWWAMQTVQWIVVSFEILTIQAVNFVEFSR